MLAPASPAEAAFPGQNGKLAFFRPNEGVHVANLDGTGLIRIGGTADPQWSPDSERIAYIDCLRSSCDIYLANADGSGTRPLITYAATDRTPAWSPDGSRLLFASPGPLGESSTWDTYIVNANGSGARKISDLGALEAEWSPDGEAVYFAQAEDRYPAAGGGIWRMHPDGTDAIRLVGGEPEVIYQSPAISPDGSRLAFSKTTGVVGDRPCCSEIFTMDTDGTDVKQVTTSGGSHVAWSPDGTKLVIDGLATINPDGSGLEQLAVTGVQPDWQPLPFKNHSKQCKALPGERRNHGQCVKAAH
jgi:Tol biopolymer transport system component